MRKYIVLQNWAHGNFFKITQLVIYKIEQSSLNKFNA
jgi:hypothetical protein